MIVLAIDIETTGLDPKVDQLTEIGCVHFHYPSKKIITEGSVLILGDKPISDEIHKLTGISNNMRDNFGINADKAIANLRGLADAADYCMAHNAAFEKSFLGDLGKPWVDTTTDLEFAPEITTRKLIHLAAEHGVCTHTRHRALADARTMVEIALQYAPAQVRKYADSPTLTIQAEVDFNGKDKAKERGYRWEPKKKIWWKHIKTFQLEEEKASAPFPVLVLQPEEEDVP